MHPGTGTIDARSLLLELRAMHIQAIAIQHIARVLRWNDVSEHALIPSFHGKSDMVTLMG